MELCESTFKKITIFSKIGGVALFAIGTDRLVAGKLILAIFFMTFGIILFFIPFKITIKGVKV